MFGLVWNEITVVSALRPFDANIDVRHIWRDNFECAQYLNIRLLRVSRGVFLLKLRQDAVVHHLA